MVERSRRSAGATIGACRAAAVEGVAVNLAGGTHHAQRDRGAGYCVFNDAAIAARVVQADSARTRRQARVAIVDLDVHQGDGTAQILAGDASVFTLSLHGARNFPFRKQASDLDVALPDGTADDAYLTALDAALAELQRRFDPQFIIYLAGADAHEDDRLGKLALTMGGMAARDQRVFDFAERLSVPIAVAMAGGYGRDIETTVAIHLQTVRAARDAWLRRRYATRSAGPGVCVADAHAGSSSAHWFALMPFVFVLLWSTGFIVAKYAAPYAPPLTFLLYRFAGVIVVLLPLGLAHAGALAPDAARLAGHGHRRRAASGHIPRWRVGCDCARDAGRQSRPCWSGPSRC